MPRLTDSLDPRFLDVLPKARPVNDKPAVSLAVPTPAIPSEALQSKRQASSLKQGNSQQNVGFVDDKPTPATQTRNIDNKAVFFDGNAATGAEIDAMLKRYGSPHYGKGDQLVKICREQKINPILLLAVMQQESTFGNKKNNPHLNEENIANPWSVHFNESAKGIKKLRLKDGSMPSFEQSLEGAIRTLKNLAGDSATPLTQAGKRYSTTGSWTSDVMTHYRNLQSRIGKSRG